MCSEPAQSKRRRCIRLHVPAIGAVPKRRLETDGRPSMRILGRLTERVVRIQYLRQLIRRRNLRGIGRGWRCCCDFWMVYPVLLDGRDAGRHRIEASDQFAIG